MRKSLEKDKKGSLVVVANESGENTVVEDNANSFSSEG